eukprot:364570-Chlamydomonas_euryale.AAC.15
MSSAPPSVAEAGIPTQRKLTLWLARSRALAFLNPSPDQGASLCEDSGTVQGRVGLSTDRPSREAKREKDEAVQEQHDYEANPVAVEADDHAQPSFHNA